MPVLEKAVGRQMISWFVSVTTECFQWRSSLWHTLVSYGVIINGNTTTRALCANATHYLAEGVSWCERVLHALLDAMYLFLGGRVPVLSFHLIVYDPANP